MLIKRKEIQYVHPAEGVEYRFTLSKLSSGQGLRFEAYNDIALSWAEEKSGAKWSNTLAKKKDISKQEMELYRLLQRGQRWSRIVSALVSVEQKSDGVDDWQPLDTTHWADVEQFLDDVEDELILALDEYATECNKAAWVRDTSAKAKKKEPESAG